MQAATPMTMKDYAIDSDILELKVLAETMNDTCMDCGVKDPDWVSLDFGVLICMQCAGIHRSFGSHITRVKSLKLDNWSDMKIEKKYLILGGNYKFFLYIESLGAQVRPERGNLKETRVRTQSGSSWGDTKQLYNSSEVLYYREMLLARVENRQPIALYSFLGSQAEDDSDQVFSGEDEDKEKEGRESTPGNIFLQGSIDDAKEGNAPWVPDLVVNKCMICDRKFGLLARKHHCRQCGKCVCVSCAPSKNTKPIKSMGLHEPVRHCKLCYRSPIVNWAKLEKQRPFESVDIEGP